jgi:hypothetical protein
MDRKLQYNVWMRKGNSWEAILKTEVSQVTAEALAVMMAQERYLPYTDERFCVSIGRPSSMNFEDKAVAVKGCIIDKLADRVLREMEKSDKPVDYIGLGVERWHLLQQAGLINSRGMITKEGRDHVRTHLAQ